MALDWAKAFDAVDPQAMLAALHRFGLPSHVLQIIGAIYSGRRFQVQDCGETSAERVQHSGISQGCPLSPFLFVMIMSVLMVDTVKELPECDKSLLLKGDLSDLLYADDTLLLSVSASSLERFLQAVSNAGATYGHELHWGKLQLVRVSSEASVRRPDHTAIEAKPEITYLGSVVSHDQMAVLVKSCRDDLEWHIRRFGPCPGSGGIQALAVNGKSTSSRPQCCRSCSTVWLQPG